MPRTKAFLSTIAVLFICSEADGDSRDTTAAAIRNAIRSDILRLAKLKLWRHAAERLSALDREVGDDLPRDSAMCTVAVNTMARLGRPDAAERYFRLMAPQGKGGQNTTAPLSALGALLKSYCLVSDLPRARTLFVSFFNDVHQDKANVGRAQAEQRLGYESTAETRLANESRAPRGEGHGRMLSTYLRCCVKAGNMSAACEALELFGSTWITDDTCCFLVIRLLCLKLHVKEAWQLASLALSNAQTCNRICKVASDYGGGGRKPPTVAGDGRKRRRGGDTDANAETAQVCDLGQDLGSELEEHARVAMADMCMAVAKSCAVLRHVPLAQSALSAVDKLLASPQQKQEIQARGDMTRMTGSGDTNPKYRSSRRPRSRDKNKFLSTKEEEIAAASRTLKHQVEDQRADSEHARQGSIFGCRADDVVWWFSRLLVMPHLPGDAAHAVEALLDSCGLQSALAALPRQDRGGRVYDVCESAGSEREEPAKEQVVIGGSCSDVGAARDEHGSTRHCTQRRLHGMLLRTLASTASSHAQERTRRERPSSSVLRDMCKLWSCVDGKVCLSNLVRRLAQDEPSRSSHGPPTAASLLVTKSCSPKSAPAANRSHHESKPHIDHSASALGRVQSVKRIYLELGCGDGEWAVTRAVRAREMGEEEAVWVCVELRLDRAVEAHRKVVAQRLTNVLVVCADACMLLERGLSTECIDAVFVRFPQPPRDVVAARLDGGVAWGSRRGGGLAGGGEGAGGGGQGDARDEDEGKGCEEQQQLLSTSGMHNMWRVLRPRAYLKVVTDSLALARLTATIASRGFGGHASTTGDVGKGGNKQEREADQRLEPEQGAEAGNGRDRGVWVSDRLCVRRSRDPTPAGAKGIDGASRGVSRPEEEEESELCCAEGSGEGRMVMEEQVYGVHIYRMLRGDTSSFFGRMWQRGRAPNFLLQLRKARPPRSRSSPCKQGLDQTNKLGSTATTQSRLAAAHVAAAAAFYR